MTKINKVTLSQIDGNDSTGTSIFPEGSLVLYNDANGLRLAYHNGITNGGTTVSASNAFDLINIRNAGTISREADVFAIAANANSNVEISTTDGTNTKVWSFDNTGILTLPQYANSYSAISGNALALFGDDINAMVYSYVFLQNNNDAATQPTGIYNTVGNVEIGANGNHYWKFDNSGTFTLPSNSRAVFAESAAPHTQPTSFIQSGEGFHITSMEGVSIDATSSVPVVDSQTAVNNNLANNNYFLCQIANGDPIYPNMVNVGIGWTANGPGVNNQTVNDIINNGDTYTVGVVSGTFAAGETYTFTSPTITGYNYNTKSWYFGPTGNLTLPPGGDILNYNGTSVLHSGSFFVAGDDSTLREVQLGETLQIVGAGGATVTTNPEGKITITAGGGGGGSDTATKLTLTQSPFITDYWVGDWVYFERTPYGTETDTIDTGLIIARNNNGRYIYNAASEVDDNTTSPSTSPAGTEWNADGWGDLSDVKRRTYWTFPDIATSDPEVIQNLELVMHDTINDKYYAIKFHTWITDDIANLGNIITGAFSYSRRQINTSVFFYRDGSNTDVSGNYATLDTGLAIARASGGAIYNPLHPTTPESSWSNGVSPAGTLWNAEGWDDLSNVTTRSYVPLWNLLKEAVGLMIMNPEFVMHDTVNNKYYAIKFTHWGVKNNGTTNYAYPEYGFSYRLINTAASSSGLKFVDGTIQQTAFTERRLSYIPRSPLTSQGSDNWLGPDDMGKFVLVRTANTTIQITNTSWQEFPVGSVLTIVNLSAGNAFVQASQGYGEGNIRIWGTGTELNYGTKWSIPGNGNMATIMLVDKGYAIGGKYSDWMLTGPGIARVF